MHGPEKACALEQSGMRLASHSIGGGDPKATRALAGKIRVGMGRSAQISTHFVSHHLLTAQTSLCMPSELHCPCKSRIRSNLLDFCQSHQLRFPISVSSCVGRGQACRYARPGRHQACDRLQCPGQSQARQCKRCVWRMRWPWASLGWAKPRWPSGPLVNPRPLPRQPSSHADGCGPEGSQDG